MSESIKEVLNIFVDEAGDPTLLGNRKCWRADSRSNATRAYRTRLMCTRPDGGIMARLPLFLFVNPHANTECQA